MRISNIITFISISFIILGLLITNIKEKNKINYAVIFEYIQFYPTLYFSFGVIIILIIQSTFRQIFSPYVLINFTILNLFLIIVILFSILRLFFRIIKCIDVEYLNYLFTKELEYQAEYQVLKDLIQLKSLNIYRKLLQEIGIEEYNHFNKRDYKIEVKSKSFLINVDLDRLIKLLKPSESKGTFYPIFLGQDFSQKLTILEFDNKLTKSTKQKIIKTYKMSKMSLRSSNYNNYYELVVDKLMQSVDNSDNLKLNLILEDIEMLQEIYFKYETYLNEAKI
jgi:hypothetical protein